MIQNTCDLKSCFLCKLCLKEWLPAIAANKKNIEIKKGQQLFKEGTHAEGIYFVYSGILKVHKKWSREKDLILRFARQGDIVGQMGLGNSSIYPVSATAVETTIVCFIDLTFFESTLKVNNSFGRGLITELANQLQESEKRMRNLVHMPVKGRVAQALLTLKDQFGVTGNGYLNIELTRQDLASFTGAVYESLFRSINDLVEDKLIIVSGKQISISDESGLKKLTEEGDF